MPGSDSMYFSAGLLHITLLVLCPGRGVHSGMSLPLTILMLGLEGVDHTLARKDDVSTANGVCQFWTRLGQRAGAAWFTV